MMRKVRSPSRASPSRRSRVTPGRSSTSASFRPTSRLNRVDLPTFGRPDDGDGSASWLAASRLATGSPCDWTGPPTRARVDFEPLAQGRRGFAVGRDLVEPAAGSSMSPALEARQAESSRAVWRQAFGRRREAARAPGAAASGRPCRAAASRRAAGRGPATAGSTPGSAASASKAFAPSSGSPGRVRPRAGSGRASA